MAVVALVLVAAPAEADRARCLSALRPLAEAKLDDAVSMAWERCPCDWKAKGAVAAARVRRSFGVCIKTTARQLVASRELPPSCYAEVKRSAEHSTCGRFADGAVTCCVPAAPRCIVTKPLLGDVTSEPPRPARTGTEHCLAIDGTPGESPTCYDACVPPGMKKCDGTEDPDAAFERATRTIAAAQGKPFDVSDPKQAGLVLLQAPHELGCRETGWMLDEFGPRTPPP